LTLLRIVQQEKMTVGQTYNVDVVARLAEPVTRPRLQEALTTSSNKEAKESLRKILNNRLSMLNNLNHINLYFLFLLYYIF